MVNSSSFDAANNNAGEDRSGAKQARSTQGHETQTGSQSASPVTGATATSCEPGSSHAAAADNSLPCVVAAAIETATTKTNSDDGTMVAHDNPNQNESESDDKSPLCCSVPLEKVQGVLPAHSKPDNGSTLDRAMSKPKLLCLFCDRSFGSVNLRQKHVERVHSAKQNRRISGRRQNISSTPCSHCDNMSKTEHTLNDLFKHMVSSHPTKYFGCLPCEDRFITQSHLTDHNNAKHPESVEKNISTYVTTESPSPSIELVFTSPESEDSTPQKITRSRLKPKLKDPLSLPEDEEEFKKPADVKKKRSSLKDLKNKTLSMKTSKVVVKRSKRLQAQVKEIESEKRRTSSRRVQKTIDSEPANSTKSPDKTKLVSINPYPEFDGYYRFKKITDHSIDNLKISSLTFDDVFDKAFFNRIKCNIEDNLLHHIDGKLFKNEESETRISNFEKVGSQTVQSTSSENYGCELSLNAITPVAALSLNSQYGEDFESQIEYGSKPSKKKTTPVKKDEIHYKYFTRRKYQASILEQKENRDLSRLDMWTQLVIKERQQNIINDKKSPKEILEYTSGKEYKSKIKREELDRILDRRGPFEDLKEEISKKAAFDKLNSTSEVAVSAEVFTVVREVVNEILTRVLENCEEEPISVTTDKQTDNRLIPAFLNLRRTSSLPDEEMDKSDRIALICSSQETENFELPTNKARRKNEAIELSGEWARSRIYICAACGDKSPNIKFLLEHKSLYHPNVWVQHYEFVGNQSELYHHLSIPGLGKMGVVEEESQCKQWRRSEARTCAKCKKQCNSLGELHRHVLECGGDWTWILARKKCKYRPFGAKSRRKRRGFITKIRRKEKTDLLDTDKKIYKKSYLGPRSKPSDAETIQRMLANLPAKRSRRSFVSLRDVIFKSRKHNQNANTTPQSQEKSDFRSSSKSKPKQNQRLVNLPSNKRTLRSINKVLSSTILDSSLLRVKRKIKLSNEQRITRQSQKGSDSSENISASEPLKDATISTSKKSLKEKESLIVTNTNIQNKIVRKRMLNRLNIKNFFPVKKRNTKRNTESEILGNPTNLRASRNIPSIEKIKESRQGGGLKGLVRNLRKKNNSPSNDKPTSPIRKSKLTRQNSKESVSSDKSIGKGNKALVNVDKADSKIKSDEVEPAFIKDKPETKTKEKKCLKKIKPLETKSLDSKPKNKILKKKFQNIINNVKKLKLDGIGDDKKTDKRHSSAPNAETVVNPHAIFLEKGNLEKPDSSVKMKDLPASLEAKEEGVMKESFAPAVMSLMDSKENPAIPEKIFNLEPSNEEQLQAKGELNFDKKVEIVPSSSVSTESLITSNISSSSISTMLSINVEFPDKSKNMVSPSLVSPNIKGKIRKPNKGLNDCIAMLTSKLQQKGVAKLSPSVPVEPVAPQLQESVEKREDHSLHSPKLDIQPQKSECILRIPTFKVTAPVGDLYETALDLSKKSVESMNVINKLNKTCVYFEPPKELQLSEFGSTLNKVIGDVIEHNCKEVLSEKLTSHGWTSVNDIIQKVINSESKNLSRKSEPFFSKNNVDESIEAVVKRFTLESDIALLDLKDKGRKKSGRSVRKRGSFAKDLSHAEITLTSLLHDNEKISKGLQQPIRRSAPSSVVVSEVPKVLEISILPSVLDDNGELDIEQLIPETKLQRIIPKEDNSFIKTDTNLLKPAINLPIDRVHQYSESSRFMETTKNIADSKSKTDISLVEIIPKISLDKVCKIQEELKELNKTTDLVKEKRRYSASKDLKEFNKDIDLVKEKHQKSASQELKELNKDIDLVKEKEQKSASNELKELNKDIDLVKEKHQHLADVHQELTFQVNKIPATNKKVVKATKTNPKTVKKSRGRGKKKAPYPAPNVKMAGKYPSEEKSELSDDILQVCKTPTVSTSSELLFAENIHASDLEDELPLVNLTKQDDIKNVNKKDDIVDKPDHFSEGVHLEETATDQKESVVFTKDVATNMDKVIKEGKSNTRKKNKFKAKTFMKRPRKKKSSVINTKINKSVGEHVSISNTENDLTSSQKSGGSCENVQTNSSSSGSTEPLDSSTPILNNRSHTRRKSKTMKKIDKVDNELFKDFTLVINKKTKRIPPTSIVDDSVCDDSLESLSKSTENTKRLLHEPDDSVQEMDMELEEITLGSAIIERDIQKDTTITSNLNELGNITPLQKFSVLEAPNENLQLNDSTDTGEKDTSTCTPKKIKGKPGRKPKIKNKIANIDDGKQTVSEQFSTESLTNDLDQNNALLPQQNLDDTFQDSNNKLEVNATNLNVDPVLTELTLLPLQDEALQVLSPVKRRGRKPKKCSLSDKSSKYSKLLNNSKEELEHVESILPQNVEPVLAELALLPLQDEAAQVLTPVKRRGRKPKKSSLSDECKLLNNSKEELEHVESILPQNVVLVKCKGKNKKIGEDKEDIKCMAAKNNFNEFEHLQTSSSVSSPQRQTRSCRKSGTDDSLVIQAPTENVQKQCLSQEESSTADDNIKEGDVFVMSSEICQSKDESTELTNSTPIKSKENAVVAIKNNGFNDAKDTVLPGTLILETFPKRQNRKCKTDIQVTNADLFTEEKMSEKPLKDEISSDAISSCENITKEKKPKVNKKSLISKKSSEPMQVSETDLNSLFHSEPYVELSNDLHLVTLSSNSNILINNLPFEGNQKDLLENILASEESPLSERKRRGRGRKNTNNVVPTTGISIIGEPIKDSIAQNGPPNVVPQGNQEMPLSTPEKSTLSPRRQGRKAKLDPNQLIDKVDKEEIRKEDNLINSEDSAFTPFNSKRRSRISKTEHMGNSVLDDSGNKTDINFIENPELKENFIDSGVDTATPKTKRRGKKILEFLKNDMEISIDPALKTSIDELSPSNKRKAKSSELEDLKTISKFNNSTDTATDFEESGLGEDSSRLCDSIITPKSKRRGRKANDNVTELNTFNMESASNIDLNKLDDEVVINKKEIQYPKVETCKNDSIVVNPDKQNKTTGKPSKKTEHFNLFENYEPVVYKNIFEEIEEKPSRTRSKSKAILAEQSNFIDETLKEKSSDNCTIIDDNLIVEKQESSNLSESEILSKTKEDIFSDTINDIQDTIVPDSKKKSQRSSRGRKKSKESAFLNTECKISNLTSTKEDIIKDFLENKSTEAPEDKLCDQELDIFDDDMISKVKKRVRSKSKHKNYKETVDNSMAGNINDSMNLNIDPKTQNLDTFDFMAEDPIIPFSQRPKRDSNKLQINSVLGCDPDILMDEPIISLNSKDIMKVSKKSQKGRKKSTKKRSSRITKTEAENDENFECLTEPNHITNNSLLITRVEISESDLDKQADEEVANLTCRNWDTLDQTDFDESRLSSLSDKVTSPVGGRSPSLSPQTANQELSKVIDIVPVLNESSDIFDQIKKKPVAAEKPLTECPDIFDQMKKNPVFLEKTLNESSDIFDQIKNVVENPLKENDAAQDISLEPKVPKLSIRELRKSKGLLIEETAPTKPILNVICNPLINQESNSFKDDSINKQEDLILLPTNFSSIFEEQIIVPNLKNSHNNKKQILQSDVDNVRENVLKLFNSNPNLDFDALKNSIEKIAKPVIKNKRRSKDLASEIEPLTDILNSSDMDIAPVIDEIDKSLEMDDIYDFDDDSEPLVSKCSNKLRKEDVSVNKKYESNRRTSNRTAKSKALEHIHDEALADFFDEGVHTSKQNVKTMDKVTGKKVCKKLKSQKSSLGVLQVNDVDNSDFPVNKLEKIVQVETCLEEIHLPVKDFSFGKKFKKKKNKEISVEDEEQKQNFQKHLEFSNETEQVIESNVFNLSTDSTAANGIKSNNSTFATPIDPSKILDVEKDGCLLNSHLSHESNSEETLWNRMFAVAKTQTEMRASPIKNTELDDAVPQINIGGYDGKDIENKKTEALKDSFENLQNKELDLSTKVSSTKKKSGRKVKKEKEIIQNTLSEDLELIENNPELVESLKENQLVSLKEEENIKVIENEEKTDNQELRRSRRGSQKIVSYNENDLIDPVIEAYEKKRQTLHLKKDKVDKKNADNSLKIPAEKPKIYQTIETSKPEPTKTDFVDKIYEFTDSPENEENANDSISALRKNKNKQQETNLDSSLSDTKIEKIDKFKTPSSVYCDICKKTFQRIENLIKHKTTLTHISKLSELEAMEVELKNKEKVLNAQQNSSDSIENRDNINISDILESDKSISNKEQTPFSNNDTLQLEDIINEVLNKPDIKSVAISDSKVNNYNCYNPESDTELETLKLKNKENYSPTLSKTIAEKQISLLENIIEKTGGGILNNIFEPSNQIESEDEYRETTNVDDIESSYKESSECLKKNDILSSSNNKTINKPDQYDEISEDSTSLSTFDEQKARKILNRDEELFLECCSLLKSSSEVSNFSKKEKLQNSFDKRLDIIGTRHQLIQPKEDAHEYSDNSRTPTPLGDTFDDNASGSNSIVSEWNPQPVDNAGKNFTFKEALCGELLAVTSKDTYNKDTDGVDLVIQDRDETITSSSPELFEQDHNKADSEEIFPLENKKIITKGARKVFEGLRISIPTEDLDLDIINCHKNDKSNNLVDNPGKSKGRKSKPTKKSQTGGNVLFKAKKKKSPLTPVKTNDVYNFEETQELSDIFTKPETFRNQKDDKNIETDTNSNHFDDSNGAEADLISNASSYSLLSTKKSEPIVENITKKKSKVMSKIFKNAAKSRMGEIEAEMRDMPEIPEIDNLELVENYVLSCSRMTDREDTTPEKDEEEPTKTLKDIPKTKMTEQEMDELFDQLIGKKTEEKSKEIKPKNKSLKAKSESSSKKSDLKKTDIKNGEGKKKQPKPKGRKRARSDSETDDEFNLNKTKKQSRKKKEEDNVINLEQELRECIGVASRKSQRSCTSGKQNVLTEYWSSDDEAFEKMLQAQNNKKPIKPSKKSLTKEELLSETIEKTLDSASDSIIKENSVDKDIEEENLKPKPTNKKKPGRKKKVTNTTDTGKKDEKLDKTEESAETVTALNRRKRVASNPLYHWSSSSEDDEPESMVEITSIREDEEDDRPIQHGWIVGDSPKKLVTMLALTKGKKTDVDCVKEQNKKRTSAVS